LSECALKVFSRRNPSKLLPGGANARCSFGRRTRKALQNNEAIFPQTIS
jgi:hypothetical protein